MSYKPTNEDVIAYLYGEMEESAKAQLEEYIAKHPEFKAKLEEMEGTRMLMGQLDDEEVPSPITFMPYDNNSEWLYWRKYVAIAASLLLVLTFGKVIGFNLSYDENGFNAGFGVVEQGLSTEEVNELLQADRAEFMNFVRDNIESVRDSISGELIGIQASIDSQETQSPELVLSDAQINNLLEKQKEDLMNQMAQLSDKMTDDYRDIFKGLYDSFSNNIETQRQDDLRNIQAAFTTLEDATLNNQEKVEDALFNLSQEVNSLIAQNNNNNK